MRPTMTILVVGLLLAGCGKTADNACAQVREVLARRDDDAWRAQCEADLRACDPAHPDDNAPLYGCLSSARDRGQVAACLGACPNPRYHGRSFMVFGERLRAP